MAKQSPPPRARNNRRLSAIALVVLCGIAGIRGTAASAQAVLDVRLGNWPDRTRLVIETGEALEFHVGDSSGQENLRLILDDVNTAALQATLEAGLPKAHPHLKRYGVDKRGEKALITLSFDRPMVPRIFALKPDHGYGHRLVIDLYSAKNGAGEPESRQTEDSVRAAGNVAYPGDRGEERPAPNQSASGTGSHRPRHPSPARSDSDPQISQKIEELWVETRLNSLPERRTVLVLKRGDELFLGGEDLRFWRMRVPSGGGIRHLGQSYYSLSRLDIESKLDLRRLTLDLKAPAERFAATAVSSESSKGLSLTPSPPGACLNYDMSTTRVGEELSFNGLFEVAAFNGWGSGTSNFLVKDGPATTSGGLIRLDTTLRRDSPAEMRTLRLGDTFTRGTNWSGAVRFGGIQWGTNFDTRPELVTMPLMDFAGEASLPSTVDLYVNDALRLSRDIPPGPFTIDQIPVVTGAGEARMVVRDILGREQVITSDFYGSRRLLREGLSDFSLELGLVRENFGIVSNDYGDPFGAATFTTGLSDRFTLEAHAQIQPDQQMAGAGGAWLLPWNGVVHAAVAGSQGDGEKGYLTSFGVQRQGRRLSVGFDSQFASEGFSRLGDESREREIPAAQFRTSASLTTPHGGTVGLSYTLQDYRRERDIEFVSASYSFNLAFGYVGMSALHFPGSGRTNFNLYFTMPLGRERSNASAGFSHGASGGETTFQLQRSPPVGTGFGYRLQAGMGQTNRQQGGLRYQNDYGIWEMEGSRVNGETGFRANISGGLALLGGDFFLSRPISDSFAVVDVPGFDDVRVYAENQEIANTNANGRALIPRLRSYERNRLSIEQADLPLNARIGKLEKEVSPYYRSGVLVGFDVSRTRDVLLHIALEDGGPLPSGAYVELKDGGRFPVGMDGQVYLTDVKRKNELHVYWQQQQCTIEMEVPESDDPILDLGEFTCGGIER